MAETYDVALAPHCPLGPIALAACIAVGVSKLNCVYFAGVVHSTPASTNHYLGI
jgi:L-alanine-DL-glutamate epimerase-like enolase superfamily enzyme